MHAIKIKNTAVLYRYSFIRYCLFEKAMYIKLYYKIKINRTKLSIHSFIHSYIHTFINRKFIYHKSVIKTKQNYKTIIIKSNEN